MAISFFYTENDFLYNWKKGTWWDWRIKYQRLKEKIDAATLIFRDFRDFN